MPEESPPEQSVHSHDGPSVTAQCSDCHRWSTRSHLNWFCSSCSSTEYWVPYSCAACRWGGTPGYNTELEPNVEPPVAEEDMPTFSMPQISAAAAAFETYRRQQELSRQAEERRTVFGWDPGESVVIASPGDTVDSGPSLTPESLRAAVRVMRDMQYRPNPIWQTFELPSPRLYPETFKDEPDQ